jgi:hypothetical protein
LFLNIFDKILEVHFHALLMKRVAFACFLITHKTISLATFSDTSIFDFVACSTPPTL